MQESKSYVIPTAIVLLSLINIGWGWLDSNALYVAGGGIGICYMLMRLTGRGRAPREEAPEQRAHDPTPAQPGHVAAARKPADPNDTDALVEQMLAQGRFALLMRPQIAGSLSPAHFRRTLEALEEAMALVPDGEVALGRIDEGLDDGRLDDEEIAAAQGRVVQVERFFLDRYPVTNRQFYEFTAAGGYEQMSLWERSIWPAVLDLVDATGMPGPRTWRDGCFLPGQEDHPVVGVSWYEGSAYARWVGKRLPSDAEWAKAGSWPVQLSSRSRVQRKYPWGDTMDRRSANLWGSGPNRIVPVSEFAKGVSVGGVYQLIGNVWEWTSGNFRASDHPEGDLLLPTLMKNIRGGAFDTYFDNQATCQFKSGENPLRRRHNIGFRCAVGVRDLTLAQPAAAQTEPASEERTTEQPALTAEEVHA